MDAEGLPASYARVVEVYWRPLAEWLARAASNAKRGLVVGINGAQGSGKTTLCLFLEVLLWEDHARRVVTLSLDDLYLSKAQRLQLARSVHPLLATRGVPGTHDVELGLSIAQELLRGTCGWARLPRFDKAIDDQASQETRRNVLTPVDIVLFEGWCVGAVPQPDSALEYPINRLEAEHDSRGVWRHYVNQSLTNDYRALFHMIDLLVVLKAPGFGSILEWRKLQERKLRQRTKPELSGVAMMTDADIDAFVMHFERLTRHMLADLPGRADAVVHLDTNHTVVHMQTRKPTRARPRDHR